MARLLPIIITRHAINELGFFTMPCIPGGSYTQTLKEDREAVLLADRLGYCEAYIGEHVTTCANRSLRADFYRSVAHDKQINRQRHGQPCRQPSRLVVRMSRC